MTAAQDAMNTLSAQWYNAITTGCRLARDQFQLIQGNQQVGTTSEALWNLFDVVPPLTASTYYNPAQVNSFSQDYAGVISALLPQNGPQFVKDMGSYYSAWNSYKSTISPIPKDTLAWSQAFQSWARANLPEGLVPRCVGDFNTMLEDPIMVAANQLLQVQFATSNPGVYAYTTTYEQMQTLLSSAAPGNAVLDSTTTSSDVSNTWAQVEAAGIFDIFGLGGESSYQSTTVKVTKAGVKISAKFDKLLTLAAGPLKTPSSDTLLSKYTPWFNSSALNTAYQKKDNTVWQAGDAINWDSTFGADGNLKRTAAALIIVDGIHVSMSSNAGLTTSEQQSFEAAASGGIFPFFEAEGSGGWSREVDFDDQGNVSVTTSCEPGNPQILGVLVSNISDIL